MLKSVLVLEATKFGTYPTLFICYFDFYTIKYRHKYVLYLRYGKRNSIISEKFDLNSYIVMQKLNF